MNRGIPLRELAVRQVGAHTLSDLYNQIFEFASTLTHSTLYAKAVSKVCICKFKKGQTLSASIDHFCSAQQVGHGCAVASGIETCTAQVKQV
eukprot:4385060-Pleurochrysis_carterae.AAC.3